MVWARSSSIERVVACPASSVIPSGPDTRSEAVQEAADWGTFVHHWAATGTFLELEKWPNFPKLLKDRLSRMPGEPEEFRAELWPVTGRHEVTFAIDVVKPGRIASFQGSKDQVKDWSAQLGDNWLKGEADYVGETAFGALWIDDLKTGRYPPDPKSGQLLTYALGAYLSIPIPDRPKYLAVSVTHWPRYPKDSPPQRTWGKVTPLDLKKWYLTLQATKQETTRLRALPVVKVIAATNPGEHCTFCPAKSGCPAGSVTLH